jgi:predicted PhzF superfamily epimerase YddE/YHI9
LVEVRSLRIFTDEGDRHGNRLGVVLAGTGTVQIVTPGGPLPFAGHPMVGTAWLLARELAVAPTVLHPPGGPVPTWTEGPAVWITASLAATPPWWHERLGSAAAVAALRGPQHGSQDATQLWAWEDEEAGHVRARVFAGRLGIVEDEACGSACMRLAAALGRALLVRHGDGSMVAARPGATPGTADVGGRVVAEPVRRL